MPTFQHIGRWNAGRRGDGTGLSLNPTAPHAPQAATAIELWAEKRAQVENGQIDAAEYEDWKASL